MQNFGVCDINIEKSSTAKNLESKYGIEWAFDQQIHLDTSFEMRACITKPITIKANNIIAIPTGI